MGVVQPLALFRPYGSHTGGPRGVTLVRREAVCSIANKGPLTAGLLELAEPVWG